MTRKTIDLNKVRQEGKISIFYFVRDHFSADIRRFSHSNTALVSADNLPHSASGRNLRPWVNRHQSIEFTGKAATFSQLLHRSKLHWVQLAIISPARRKTPFRRQAGSLHLGKRWYFIINRENNCTHVIFDPGSISREKVACASMPSLQNDTLGTFA